VTLSIPLDFCLREREREREKEKEGERREELNIMDNKKRLFIVYTYSLNR